MNQPLAKGLAADTMTQAFIACSLLLSVASSIPAPDDIYYKPTLPKSLPYKPNYPPNPYEPPVYVPPHPKQNCTVKDEVIHAEICTPSFQTQCTEETITVKKIISRDYCFDLATTVCDTTEETIDNDVCVYQYNEQDEATTAKTVKVDFTKECNTQMVTVCDPGYQYHGGYQHHGYGSYCKEVQQTTCFNQPKVAPVDVPVTVSFPVPEKKCESKPIVLPRVSCQVKTEKKCIPVPDVQDDIQLVEKCQPVIGTPLCQKVELVLPKQVCQDLVYGYAHKPANYEH